MDKTRQETEQRIAQRYELLEQELQEFTAAIEGEIGRIEGRVQAFEAELARSFEQLMETSDPSEFTYLAEHMPEPPPFVEPDSAALVQEYRLRREQTLLEESPSEESPSEGSPSEGSPSEESPSEESPSEESPSEESPSEESPSEESPSEESPSEGSAALPDHWWLDSPAATKAKAQLVDGASQSG
jgi:hypothetical protein